MSWNVRLRMRASNKTVLNAVFRVFLEVATLPALSETELKDLTKTLPEIKATRVLDELSDTFNLMNTNSKSNS